MLFNILELNAQSCVRGVAALMVTAGVIACSLSMPKQFTEPVQNIQAATLSTDAEALLAEAETYKMVKDYNRALPLLDRYISLVPDNAEAFADKAYCYNGLHKFNDALTSAEQGLKCDSENVNVLSNKAWALNHLGKHKEALETAKTALNIDPGDAESWCSEGEALMGIGDYNSALVAFNKHCGLHPTEWYAYDRRAYCYEKLGLKAAAAVDRKMADSL